MYTPLHRFKHISFYLRILRDPEPESLLLRYQRSLLRTAYLKSNLYLVMFNYDLILLFRA